MHPTRVVLHHRNRLLREGVALILSRLNDVDVADETASADELFGALDDGGVDVVVLDLDLPSRRGLDEARRVRSQFPDVRVLMVGVSELISDVVDCIEAGASGYLSQDASLDDLVAHVRAVAADEAICAPKVTAVLFDRVAEAARGRDAAAHDLVRLTPRERQIIALIEKGYSNKEIASRLEIGVQTVKNHVHNLLEKLRVRGRAEAAMFARRQGLVMDAPT